MTELEEQQQEQAQALANFKKAGTFELDPDKAYLVVMHSKRTLTQSVLDKIKEQMRGLFDRLGAKAEVVILSDGITMEVKVTKPEAEDYDRPYRVLQNMAAIERYQKGEINIKEAAEQIEDRYTNGETE